MLYSRVSPGVYAAERSLRLPCRHIGCTFAHVLICRSGTIVRTNTPRMATPLRLPYGRSGHNTSGGASKAKYGHMGIGESRCIWGFTIPSTKLCTRPRAANATGTSPKQRSAMDCYLAVLLRHLGKRDVRGAHCRASRCLRHPRKRSRRQFQPPIYPGEHHIRVTRRGT